MGNKILSLKSKEAIEPEYWRCFIWMKKRASAQCAERNIQKAEKTTFIARKIVQAMHAKKRSKENKKNLAKDQIIHIRNSKKTCTCRKLMQFKKDTEKEKKKKEQQKDRNKKYSKNEQPCWTCKKACGGCRWSDKLKPVKGWDAVKVKRKDDSGKENMTGYKILYCPEHEKG